METNLYVAEDGGCANCGAKLTAAQWEQGLCDECEAKVDEAENKHIEWLESGYARWLEQEADADYERIYGQRERYEMALVEDEREIPF